MRRHFINERDLTRVVAAQIGVPFVDIAVGGLSMELFERIPLKVCESWSFVPVGEENEHLAIAFADPLNENAVRTARGLVGDSILVTMSTSSSIANAIAGLRSVHESSESRKGKDGETNATAMGLVDEILQKAVDADASDVHIEPMSDRIRVRLRCDGVLREAMSFSRAELPSVGSRLKVLAEADVAERRRHQDGQINYEHPKTGAKIDIRMSVFVTVSGENIVLRVLNRKAGIRALRDIGIPELMLTQLQHDVLDTPSGVEHTTRSRLHRSESGSRGACPGSPADSLLHCGGVPSWRRGPPRDAT